MSSRLVYVSKLEKYKNSWPIRNSRPIFRTQPTMYHHHTRCDTIGRNDTGKKHIRQNRLRTTEDNDSKSNITRTSSPKNYLRNTISPHMARGQCQSRPFCPHLDGFYGDSLICSEFLAAPRLSLPGGPCGACSCLTRALKREEQK